MLNSRHNSKLGTVLFYLLWPLVWFYAPLRVRVRVMLIVGTQVAVVKNWFGPSFWQLPGGGMKFGEQAFETAVREIHEELGVDLEVTTVQQLTTEPEIVKSGGLLFRYHYVVCKLDAKPEFELSKEVIDASWVDLTSVAIPQNVIAKLS